MQSKPLFEESQFFLASVTESFHLVNTARAAIEHLCGSVQKIIDAGLDDRVIGALFPTPEGTTGQNLRALTIRDSQDTERELAHMWLAATFAHYESWAQGLAGITGVTDLERATQFPRSFESRMFSLPRSTLLPGTFAGHLQRDKLCLGSRQRIVHGLHLYRYYKEIRNCAMHSGGLASSRLVTAAVEAHPSHAWLASRTGWRGQPIAAIRAGDRVEVDLPLVRDVIALLQRLVFSIDAMLFLSAHGEVEIERRWKSEYGPAPVRLERPPTGPWLSDRVGNRLGLPNPVGPGSDHGASWAKVERQNFTKFLKERGLVTIVR